MFSAILKNDAVAHKNPSSERRVGVNAAFLREIKEDNQHVSDYLAAVAAALAKWPRRPIRPFRLVELLSRLRDELSLQFSLEDYFGYVDGAIGFDKSFSEAAVFLRNEHTDLFLDLCTIVDNAEQLLYCESSHPQGTMLSISLKFGSFYRKFQVHEHSESELINRLLPVSASLPFQKTLSVEDNHVAFT